MKVSDIYRLLYTEASGSDFVNNYKKEFVEYDEREKEVARSIQILVEDDLEFEFTRHNLSTIIKYFLSGELEENQINYIVDVLIFADKVSYEDAEVFTILETLTDPKTDGKLEKERLELILFSISEGNSKIE